MPKFILGMREEVGNGDQTSNLEVEKRGRSTYSMGVAPKDFQDSGVKKIFLLAAFPVVKESWFNIKAILTLLNLEAVDFNQSADMKLQMILVGKSQGKPTFNCPFGDGKAPFSDKCKLYTLEELASLHKKYVEDGLPSKKQAHYQNVVNEPLLCGEEQELVIDKLNPPSLHLIIGM